MSLSALRIFLSLKGKSQVEGDSTTPEGAGSSIKPKINEDAKKEQKTDIFTSSNEAETPETQATKPKTWLEQITDTGKKALDTVSEQTGKIISVTKNLWDKLPEKFKTANEQHNKKVAQTKNLLNPDKAITKSQNITLAPKKILARLKATFNMMRYFEQYQLEALKEEQEKVKQAKRELNEINKAANIPIKQQVSKTASISTPQVKRLVNQFRHLLLGFDITHNTTEVELISFLIKNNKLSLNQKQEILAQSAQPDQYISIMPQESLDKLFKKKNSNLSFSA